MKTILLTYFIIILNIFFFGQQARAQGCDNFLTSQYSLNSIKPFLQNTNQFFAEGKHKIARDNNLAKISFYYKSSPTFSFLSLPAHAHWLIFILCLVCAILFFFIKSYHRKYFNLKKKFEETINKRILEFENQRKEIEKQKDEIEKQNSELEFHKKHLENLVNERTDDLLNAKNKAEESDKLKSAFLANMSHEIRTPMNAILGFSQILISKKIEKKEQNEYIKLINESCNSLVFLIDDLLDLSKIESGQFELKKEIFSLNALMDELYTTYTSKIKHSLKPIRFELDNPFISEPFFIKADQKRLKQILTNLLSNAIKYTDKGTIKLICKTETRNSKPNLFFLISDTGIGIEKEHQDIIFERFRKIETKGKRIYRGTGLGLAISKKLVEFMNGHMLVESEVGKGSVFSFNIELDIYKLDNKTKYKNEDNDEPLNFKNKNLLIVEDDVYNYRFLEVGLKLTKANIHWAQNGKEAVEIFEKEKIDLILMDIQMPVMNGLDATKIIKSKNPQIPVIAQTAFAMSVKKDDFDEAGFDDTIIKPVILQELYKKINLFLSKA